MLTPALFFGLFVILQVVKGTRGLLFAEAIERGKLGNADARPSRFFSKMALGALLYLGGVFYAELKLLWLALAIVTVVTGLFVFNAVWWSRRLESVGVPLVPEAPLAQRARQRRLRALGELALVAVWIYAWRGVFLR